MIYNWFKVFNLDEFIALGLVSKTYTLNLTGIGIKSVLATSGNGYGIVYEGVFLCIQMNGQNPFESESHAVYLNTDTSDVYLGVPVES